MNRLDAELERCRPLIEAALARNGHTHSFSDVAARVREGKAQLWPGRASMGVSELVQHPNMLTAHGWLAAGDMDEVKAITRDFADWAKAQGAVYASLCGREGWKRALKDDGWGNPQIMLRKYL